MIKTEKRAKIEQQVMEYLKKRKLKEASLAVAAYEAEQVFPRGTGIDWKRYNPERDVEMLSNIFKNKPGILARLGNDKLEALRIGACMMALWGENKAKKWLPVNFETGLPFDNDTTARMFLFHAVHRATLERYHSEGLEHVEILAAPDSCESCGKLAGTYKLNEAPELPNPNCTGKMGCRCTFLPVV